MKFLVSGSIKHKKGPAILITFASIYVFVFLVLKFFTAIDSRGSAGNLQVFLSESSIELLLEEIHAEVFYFGFIFLYTAAVIREMILGKFRFVFIHSMFAGSIFYLCFLFLSFYFPFLFIPAVVLFYLNYAGYVLSQLYIIYFLNLQENISSKSASLKTE